MENIFKNAYFGKAYKTKDGRKVIFLRTFVCNGYNHYVSTGDLEYSVREDGKVDKNLYPYEEDIVSEWEDAINEDELDKLALRFTPIGLRYNSYSIDELMRLSYKAGYRKAKED